MRDGNYVFTSESVTEGHPDKLCDRISDAIVGRHLRSDVAARVVAECAISTGIVFVSVKMRSRSRSSVDVTGLVRDVIRTTGYDGEEFNARTCTVMTSLHEISWVGAPHVYREIDEGAVEAIVAEEQATVFGFACTHTPALMPLPVWLAHKIARKLAQARRKDLTYLSPDGKTQVAVELEHGRPRSIHGVTIIAPHDLAMRSADRGRSELRDVVLRAAFADEEIRPSERTRITINPEGFTNGGPGMHAGLTGRKTAVDTYGEFARHSGAALSGKDLGRIDRVGAYAARYVAKNVVAAGLADRCEVQLSYSIGLSHPVSVHVESFGTGRISDDEIGQRIVRTFDLRVGAIVRDLRLRELPRADPSGLLEKLAAYGHVGRTDLTLPWEATDRADALRA